jgi:hypothetical protein
VTQPDRPGDFRSAAACGSVALIACLIVIYATPNDTVWTVDCGAKALLAEQFVETNFSRLAFDYPAATVDPAGKAFPIPPPFAIRLGDAFVSQYPPAYPATAAAFYALLGPPGLRWPAALGVSACAFLFAFWVTPAFGKRWALAGGLALALATPLFFYGVTIWEHSITVALPLASVVALSRPGGARALLAGLLAGAACWYREELVFMLPALAVACLLCDRSWRSVALLAVGAAIPGAGLGLFNTVVYGHPLGVHIHYNTHASPPFAVMLRDFGALVSGYGASPTEAALLVTGTGAALALALLVTRDDRRLTLAVIAAAALGFAAWLRGTSAISSAAIPLAEMMRFNGFAVQFPLVCLAGIGFARLRRTQQYAPLRIGVLAGVAFLAFALPFRVAFSDFSSGGHWGPRMLLPAAPALLALALAAVDTPPGTSARHRGVLRGVWAALILAGLASSALSIRLLDDQKRESRALQQRIAKVEAPVVVTNYPALSQQLPALWHERPLLLVSDAADFAYVVKSLERQDIDEFLFVKGARRRLGQPPGAHCVPAGRHRGRHVARVFDVDLLLCRPNGPG